LGDNDFRKSDPRIASPPGTARLGYIEYAMPETIYRNRRAVQIENAELRVTVLAGGGHIAEIAHKQTGVNPLWTPPWPSIEPSDWRAESHPEYGNDAESRLLAGIMGHNLCLDVFGGPSAEESAAGMSVHGEASIVPYEIDARPGELTARATLSEAGLRFERRIRLPESGTVVEISETVENLTAWDRPSAWTQHVTLGPPFLVPGSTQFRAPATRSKVYETDFMGGKGYQNIGAEFDWPYVPSGAGTADLRVMRAAAPSGGYTTHLMDPQREQAYFLAWTPETRVLAGYVWKRSDFPWLGIWEENRARTHAPWNGQAVTRGMEFGVSPMPETRRQMIERGSLFGERTYRWIPARSRVEVRYRAFVTTAETIPESVEWDGAGGLRFA